ncbi:MAG: hypothetical protein JWM95_717 [Gemmatimonadetes bacterium]|nr:hypothetical protein [Gemmatimonadota bacterium]
MKRLIAPGLLVALVLLSALASLEPVRDAATLQFVSEATLRRSTGYVLLAPVSAILDTLSLLSLRQHIAFLVTIIVCYAIWWWFIGRAALAKLKAGRRAIREAARIGVGVVALVSLYTAMILLPRPTAALSAAPEIIVIDFHSHTKFSHDGRWDWSPEDVRAWHRDAGFDVAYVTDHRTFEGARDGWSNNPQTAGAGTSLFPGIEGGLRGEHVNVLDADRKYRGILTPTLRDIDEGALALASAIPGSEPILIETLPGNLANMVPGAGPGTAGVRAMEIIDGAPKGLGQTRREHDLIVHLADSLNLALVTGSDNHGWGHTSSGWTLMYIPGWRGMPPERISEIISRALGQGGKASTRVVERYVADTDNGIALPFTVPLVAWGMLRTLSTDERIVWVVWIVAAYFVWRIGRGRRRLAPAPVRA